MYKLSLAHLYPKLLNLHGSTGNVTTILKRCEWRNITVDITDINEGEKFNPQLFDICFIGSGQDLQQEIAAKELNQQKNAFWDAAESNTVFLGICGGYQLLGEYYQSHSKDIEGIGLLNTYTIAGEKRFTGNVTAKSEFINPQEIVGFENHSGLTYIKEGTTHLATTIIGKGNNGEDKTEGARKRNVFGTYLHGPILPKNPHFTDYLIELALEKKYDKKVKLEPLNDDIEINTHKNLVGKKY